MTAVKAQHQELAGLLIAIGTVLAAWMQVGVSITVNNPNPMLDTNVTFDEPYLVRLRREVHPVRRKGKVVSFMASYSGVIHVGGPQSQEFRVVFDTGSGHVVLPSVACASETCRRHRRYDMAASATAQAVDLDGSRLRPGFPSDQVTIGFGSGKITGEFVREQICLGPAPSESAGSGDSNQTGPCTQAQLVVAVDMSKRPFEFFDFDGILGLGLRGLAVSENFSFFNLLAGSLAVPHFGFYLAEGDDEESEIAIGGHNPLRLLERLSWVPVARPELGYWQVDILRVYVDGVPLELCNEQRGGAVNCTGILDTGTSHFGIPRASNGQFTSLLERPSRGVTDCRFVDAPVLDIELRGFNLTLHPGNYMRTLPVSENVTIGTGLDVKIDGGKPIDPSPLPSRGYLAAKDAPRSAGGLGGWLAEWMGAGGVSPSQPPALPAENHSGGAASGGPDDGSGDAGTGASAGRKREDRCTPKLLPVNLNDSIGPNVFVLGEPILQRYYTVYDWSGLRAGFGLAAHNRGQGGIVDARASAGPELYA